MSARSLAPTRLLDQLYTDRAVAARLVADLVGRLGDIRQTHRWLEPSAGDGAFLGSFPRGSVALDVEPRHRAIQMADFLAWSPPVCSRPWLVLGSPPCGKNASLAVRFFNHAASFADVIAFIVPRTFQKDSLQARLNQWFWLEHEEVLPFCSFQLNGAPYSVSCVFQVWRRRADPRPPSSRPMAHSDFSFTTRKLADFAVQRVGVRAGTVKTVTSRGCADASHYFLKAADPARACHVRAAFERIDWEAVKWRTASNPSISKAELVELYTAVR